MELHNWGSLEEPIALVRDIGVPRIREVREIENRKVGRLHCTMKKEDLKLIQIQGSIDNVENIL